MKEIVVRAVTRDEWIELVTILDDSGYRWTGGDKLVIDNNEYNDIDKICLFLNKKRVSWSNLNYAIETKEYILSLTEYKRLVGIKSKEINLNKSLIQAIKSHFKV